MEQPNRLPQFRERLNELMGDRSATQFASELQMSRQTLGFYLNGNRIPDAEMLKQICEKCNVSADWLLGLSNTRTLDTEVQAVCKYVGLSEASTCFLHELVNSQPYLSLCVDSLIGHDTNLGLEFLRTIRKAMSVHPRSRYRTPSIRSIMHWPEEERRTLFEAIEAIEGVLLEGYDAYSFYCESSVSLFRQLLEEAITGTIQIDMDLL